MGVKKKRVHINLIGSGSVGKFGSSKARKGGRKGARAVPGKLGPGGKPGGRP
tara:strand:- start:494 stop:649 length:156 start_codon:yes stop_codon:yes gene_type:complete